MNDNRTFLLLTLAVATAMALGVWLAARRREEPVQPVVGKVSSPFGGARNHSGVDIAVPEGTEVRCPWDGTVSRVWWDDTYGGGRSMLVKHDNGYTTGYAHLSGYHFGSGDKVRRGQNLALSGNTGSHTTGPHLHFTLRDPDGKRIDPLSIFSFA